MEIIKPINIFDISIPTIGPEFKLLKRRRITPIIVNLFVCFKIGHDGYLKKNFV